MHAFPALMIVSLGSDSARASVRNVVTAFQQGVGNTLGFIAVVIGLGTFIGGLLAESGGASSWRARRSVPSASAGCRGSSLRWASSSACRFSSPSGSSCSPQSSSGWPPRLAGPC